MAIKISRLFKDISLSFTRNPLTNDIIPLYNEVAIKKSVINLVKTHLGERLFQPLLGSTIDRSIFELNLTEINEFMPDRIKNLLSNYEPRISVLDVILRSKEEQYELEVEIAYEIIGLPLPTQTIDFLLQPSRL